MLLFASTFIKKFGFVYSIRPQVPPMAFVLLAASNFYFLFIRNNDLMLKLNIFVCGIIPFFLLLNIVFITCILNKMTEIIYLFFLIHVF